MYSPQLLQWKHFSDSPFRYTFLFSETSHPYPRHNHYFITFTVIFILTLSKGATCGVKAFITSVILLACLHSNPESDYAHSSLKRDTEKITSTKHVIQYSILINHNG